MDNAAISAAIKDVFSETRTILEPAGAVAVAGAKAYLAARPDIRVRQGIAELPERGEAEAHFSAAEVRCVLDSCASSLRRGAVSPPCKVAQHSLICVILVNAAQGQTVVAVCSGANMNFDRLRLVAELADLGAHVRPRTPSFTAHLSVKHAVHLSVKHVVHVSCLCTQVRPAIYIRLSLKAHCKSQALHLGRI